MTIIKSFTPNIMDEPRDIAHRFIWLTSQHELTTDAHMTDDHLVNTLKMLLRNDPIMTRALFVTEHNINRLVATIKRRNLPLPAKTAISDLIAKYDKIRDKVTSDDLQLKQWYTFDNLYYKRLFLDNAIDYYIHDSPEEDGWIDNVVELLEKEALRKVSHGGINYRTKLSPNYTLQVNPIPFLGITPNTKSNKEDQQMPNVSVSVSTDIEITSNASSTIKELIIAARKKEQQASYDLRDHNIQGIINANSDVSAINKHMKDVENLLGKLKFTIEVVFDQQEVLDMYLTDKDRARIEDEHAAHRARLEAIQDKYKELNALLSITETYDQKINLLKTYNIIAK